MDFRISERVHIGECREIAGDRSEVRTPLAENQTFDQQDQCILCSWNSCMFKINSNNILDKGMAPFIKRSLN